MMMVDYAKKQKFPYVFLYEEDAYPRIDVMDKFNYMKSKLPDNCGLFVMGYSGWRGPHIVINDDTIQLLHKPFGSHSYLIHSQCYDAYLNSCRMIRCPDKAFKSINFSRCIRHPYWPTVTNILFIQKNIDGNCITSKLGGERYWFPKLDGTPITSSAPQDGFENKLIDVESDFLQPIHKVHQESWRFKNYLCRIENNVIYKFTEIGDMIEINPLKKWKIIWRNTHKVEFLVLDKCENMCYYYHIEEK